MAERGIILFFSRKRMKNEWGSVAELTPLWNPSRRIFQKKKEIAGVYCGWRVISQMLNRELEEWEHDFHLKKKSFLGQDLVCESEWKKNNQQQK